MEVHVGGHPELSESKGGVVLALHVQPGARTTSIVGLHGDALKVRVAAPALDGRANEAVVALVAKAFGLTRGDVSVVSGASNRRKRVRLDGLSLAAAASVVDRLLTE